MLTELSIPTWLWAWHEDQPASRARGVSAHTLKRRERLRGVFRPVALVDGRVAATWGLSGGVMSITLREPIGSAALDALIDDAADVLRFSAFPTALPSSKDAGADCARAGGSTPSRIARAAGWGRPSVRRGLVTCRCFGGRRCRRVHE
jgi:hypothetical protein